MKVLEQLEKIMQQKIRILNLRIKVGYRFKIRKRRSVAEINIFSS
jgi:hypothetical protein